MALLGVKGYSFTINAGETIYTGISGYKIIYAAYLYAENNSCIFHISDAGTVILANSGSYFGNTILFSYVYNGNALQITNNLDKNVTVKIKRVL